MRCQINIKSKFKKKEKEKERSLKKYSSIDRMSEEDLDIFDEKVKSDPENEKHDEE